MKTWLIPMICLLAAACAGKGEVQVVEQEDFTEGLDPFESVKRSCDYVKTMRPE